LRSIAVRVGKLLRSALATCAGLACILNVTLAEDRRVNFNIPAAALADALYTYSSVTGIEVLVTRDMVARRRSAAIAGTFAPQGALRALLSGTGLGPKYMGANAFTLVPMAPASAAVFVPPSYPDYSAALQAAVTSALCRFSQTRPGDYRIAARFWVDRSGAVSQVKFLGTSGNDTRDAALAALLGHVVVGEAPPADLIQPTTVLILPRRDGSAECVGHPVPQ
jgi:TonB C terminal